MPSSYDKTVSLSAQTAVVWAYPVKLLISMVRLMQYQSKPKQD